MAEQAQRAEWPSPAPGGKQEYLQMLGLSAIHKCAGETQQVTPHPQEVKIKKQQQEVLDYLQANKIEFERCDIAVNDESKMFMRENVPENYRPVSGIPLPPQIFNNDHYCGNFEAFFDARENNAVYAFLGLTAPPGSKEAEALTKQEA
ncbi:adapter SH3BGRL-like isoform X3 [Narcine bancroftii]|uniref:adapter SH3BGRL-like isoform X3 n=1 Tax=Narcine bancroftii TaxID=1343680 RepID=UPI00383212F6